MPPPPPGVTAQQGPPPLQQFAQGAAGAAPPPSGQNSDALLSSLVDQVGKTLTQIAQITGQTKPELIPILKQAVQAIVMFAGKVKTGTGAPAGGQGQPPGALPQGQDQGTASDGAPSAGGGAAMGMPQ